MNEFNIWLTAKGFDPEAITPAQKLTLQAAWRAEINPPAPTPAPAPSPAPAPAPAAPAASSFDDTIAAIEAESARVEYIQTRTAAAMQNCIGNPDKLKSLKDLCTSAVADKKTDARAFDLALIRAERWTGPLVFAPSAPEVNESVVEAAVCRAGGLKSLEKEYDDRTISAVDKRFKGGLGLQELIGMAAKQNGWRGSSVKRDLSNALKCAFRNDDGYGIGSPVALGPSTLSVTGILSNTANKFLREAFMYVEQSWREICAIRSVSDFKQITTYSMTGDNQYIKLAAGGQIAHGTLGDEEYTNQADTYARILGIDRRDIINDDLGAFSGVSRRLGRGGALKVNDVFWTELLDEVSGTFWTAARGNFDDGTDTDFDEDGLKAADILWSAKTDPDGKPLGLRAAIILMPPTLRIAALRLMNSTQLLTADDQGATNPWQGLYKVVSSVYLENTTYTAASTKAWYMIADPNDMVLIEGVFLNGQEMPTVETVELDADRLGVAMRAYHDFGFNKQEYRAALKLKGEN